MELELGLSLANFTSTFHRKIPNVKELDLISCVSCKGKEDYSSCESSSSVDDDNEIRNYENGLKKKRREFNEVDLPLLNWDIHPNEDDDDNQNKRVCNSPSFTITKEEGDEIVGWPPINTYRKKQNEAHHQQPGDARVAAVENGGGCGGGGRSLNVKVQMQGCGITRKIDLKSYHSYQALSSYLLHMFGKGQDRSENYKLTYQDGEGDWLLAGDVPWRTFIGSVQRLKMLKGEELIS